MAADLPQSPDRRKLRKESVARKAELWTERSSWISHWKEISQFQQPRLGRFLETDVNKGNKRHTQVYDSTAIAAARVLAAGMMSGMTSPARPWFRLRLRDKDLMQNGEVKQWLFNTEELLRAIFARSNTYRSLHSLYEELGLFGTAASIVLPDFENVLHHYPLTIGEYAIATDHRGQVDTIARSIKMTTSQLAKQFGTENLSAQVKQLIERGQLNTWVDVTHLVEPRNAADPTKLDSRHMPWRSVYFETAGGDDAGILSESGFKRFPALAPRWTVTGSDIYGGSPGMEALGDTKSLQQQQFRKAQAIDFQANPPIVLPTAYKEAAKARLPGGVMFADLTGNNAIRSAFEVNLNLQHLLLDIQDVRERIRGCYYADLFMMLANDNRSGTTATEIAERHEEKLLMLGPVLERLDNELLTPLIDTAFDYAERAGILPPVPKVLEGMDIEVQFVSTLAQAQRMVSAQGMDRLIGTIGTMAAYWPQAVGKLNADKIIDDYSEFYGVNPAIVIPTQDLVEQRAAQAKAQAAQQMAAAAPALAKAGKDMGDTNQENLRDVTNGLMGYSTGAPAA